MQASMSLLKESGLNFDKHKMDGIPQSLFAEYLITSGLALNK
jgi:CCR4-NOT transcription complex subunit 7/8